MSTTETKGTALITGAFSGIGAMTNKDIALAFYKKGPARRPGRRCLPALRCSHLSPAQSADRGRHGRREEIRYLVHVERVFAHGDYVILHSHWHGLSDSPRREAVVDIFRLEGGKVLEHSDVIQPIPETSANANTTL
jgi:hypothetical protein